MGGGPRHQRAGAPPLDDVAKVAHDGRFAAFMIDTWEKDQTNLLDWMSLTKLKETCDRFRTAAIPVALAGALGLEQIRELLPARPTWFAVRGSVCAGNARTAGIDGGKVRMLVDALQSNNRLES